MRWIAGILVIVLTMASMTAQASYAPLTTAAAVVETVVDAGDQAGTPCDGCMETASDCVRVPCDPAGITPSLIRRGDADMTLIDSLLLEPTRISGVDIAPSSPPPKR